MSTITTQPTVNVPHNISSPTGVASLSPAIQVYPAYILCDLDKRLPDKVLNLLPRDNGRKYEIIDATLGHLGIVGLGSFNRQIYQILIANHFDIGGIKEDRTMPGKALVKITKPEDPSNIHYHTYLFAHRGSKWALPRGLCNQELWNFKRKEPITENRTRDDEVEYDNEQSSSENLVKLIQQCEESGNFWGHKLAFYVSGQTARNLGIL